MPAGTKPPPAPRSSTPPAPRPQAQAAPVPQALAALWQAGWLTRAMQGPAPSAHATWPSGHTALDAALPGAGWPACGLIELLQPAALHAEWALLAPGLAAYLAAWPHAGPLVCVGDPGAGRAPFMPALAAAGVPAQRLLWVRCGERVATCWAAEQALACAGVALVLVWLGPGVRFEALRRLHHRAVNHAKPLFLLRPEAERAQPSPAPLRLWAQPGARLGELALHVVKRRGPALDAPLLLPAWLPGVAAWVQATQAGLPHRLALVHSQVAAPPVHRMVEGHALDRARAA